MRIGMNLLLLLLVDHFKSSPFFSPSGVDWSADPLPGNDFGLIVGLTGSGQVAGIDGAATGPRLNTIFCVAENEGHWFGWANISDFAAKEQLQKEARVEFRVD